MVYALTLPKLLWIGLFYKAFQVGIKVVTQQYLLGALISAFEDNNENSLSLIRCSKCSEKLHIRAF